jgi:xylan 1,4-beta-xylosidase
VPRLGRTNTPVTVKRACVLVILLAVCATSRAVGLVSASPSMPPPDPPSYSNPVMAGDFPDPTAMRVGTEYWAIATASAGNPSPPILRSPDLVHWSVAGHLLTSPPPWSSGRQLWGPWLERDGERYLVYYSARKKYGRPCVTVGVSSGPIGPYTDSGPLKCQSGGSIDPSVARNVNDWPFLVWKENGGTKPSSLWTQPLGLDGLRLTGTPHKNMVGDPNSWEGGLIEGPRIIRRHNWLYLFYSGGRCCARETCKYALGVARAHGIYGPWRRAPQNPILKSNKSWKCPGHGAVLQSPSGHWWLLYNGYRALGSANRGREMLLELIHWSRDGWPYIAPGSRPRPAS